MLTFDKLLGNPQVKASLNRLLSKNRLQGSFLFSGPEGIGKSLFAQCLANAFILSESNEAKHKLEKGVHPDVRHIKTEGKSALHPMDQMKAFISEVLIPPFEATKKFFFIHEAHRMLPSSSNSLLKTLEEPPEYAVIILLTSEPGQILPTIHSRCRSFSFFPISDQDMQKHLTEHKGLTDEKALRISMLAHGSMRKAHLLIDDNKQKNEALILDLLSAHFEGNIPALLKILNQLDEQVTQDLEKEDALYRVIEIDEILDLIFFYFRDLHLLKRKVLEPRLLFFQEHIEKLKVYAAKNIPTLDEIDRAITKTRLALDRHMRLKNALQGLLFTPK